MEGERCYNAMNADSHATDEDQEDSLVRFFKASADVAGNMIGVAAGALCEPPTGAIVGAMVGPTISHVLQKIGAELSERRLGKREEKRVGTVFVHAIRKVDINLRTGKRIRRDGFFDEQPDGRSAADEIVEGVLTVSQREYEERKIPLYADLLANLAFTTQYDRPYCNLLIRIAEQLSYRQLCLLALVTNNTSALEFRSLRKHERELSDSQLAVLQELLVLHIRGVINDNSDTVWLSISDANLHCSPTPELGMALYVMMELVAIPASDIQETAQLFR
jgi:hypothetical protein